MQLMEYALEILYKNGVVSREEAMSKANDPRSLERVLD
jgi:Tfp pilus assembly pilus retraction ATPase PilT